MEGSKENSLVELKIPCRPEYVGVARLAILGMASRMMFSYDDVEDIRLAVGEACTSSVSWAEKNRKPNAQIVMRAKVLSDRISIDIIDDAGLRTADGFDPEAEIDHENIGALLVTLLVDEAQVFEMESGNHVRLIKYAKS